MQKYTDCKLMIGILNVETAWQESVSTYVELNTQRGEK